MSEIRLACPRCGAEYRVPANAIPAAGRDVECSSCGNVWFQAGGAGVAQTAAATADKAALLSRPLPESVLSVLREEADLARRQRAGQADPATKPALPLDPTPAGPAPSRHINDRPQRPENTVPQHETLEAKVNRTTPHGTLPPEPEIAPDNRAYVKGLTWSLGTAAALLLVYLATPALADRGAFGAQLAEWRQSVDQGRMWLQEKVLGAD